MSRKLLVAEVAAMLRLSESAVYALIRQGKLTASRVRQGGRLLIDETSVQTALQAARPTLRGVAGGIQGAGSGNASGPSKA